MVLVQKWPFFQCFLSGNRGQENILNDILERKNAFQGYKNKKFKRLKNCHFSKGFNPWFWSKNGHFSNFFFRKYRPWKCLLRYSRAKKRLSRLSNCFFLGNIGQENVFYDILERRNACLGYKNKKFKMLKNWHFSKGVNPWFWSKNGPFSNLFY